ncbi:unnamed protein product [Rotaria sp. Silwood2]|nr:unnamed protein product [Rotaria sp. Silwood2]CAF4258280.1 unnamed protein product [Rotaria sp. Silwood2]CAF4476885.1 unnamed protein product [Rotaria sp. Silwood2]
MPEPAASSTDVTQAKSPAILFINSNKGKPLLIADGYVFKFVLIIEYKFRSKTKIIAIQCRIDNLGERYYNHAINAMKCLDGPMGEYLDNRMGGNPNPTWGQVYGGYPGVGGYGGGYGYSYRGW